MTDREREWCHVFETATGYHPAGLADARKNAPRLHAARLRHSADLRDASNAIEGWLMGHLQSRDELWGLVERLRALTNHPHTTTCSAVEKATHAPGCRCGRDDYHNVCDPIITRRQPLTPTDSGES